MSEWTSIKPPNYVDKTQERDDIEKHIRAFKKKGGRIEKIPDGQSALDEKGRVRRHMRSYPQ